MENYLYEILGESSAKNFLESGRSLTDLVKESEYNPNLSKVQAAIRFVQAYLAEDMNKSTFVTSVKSAALLIQSELKHAEQEIFFILFLDTQGGLIKQERMFYGTINETPVYVREIMKKVLRYNAASLIISHNHPSGNLTPSEADKHITQKVKTASELIDVTLLDHIIVGYGSSGYTSFAELGLL